MVRFLRTGFSFMMQKQKAWQLILFILCWTFLHSADTRVVSGYPDPVITVKDGALIYSSDSLFNKEIVTLIDYTKATADIRGHEMYVKESSADENHTIAKPAAVINKNSRKKCVESIRKQEELVPIHILISESVNKRQFCCGPEAAGFCMASFSSGNKFYRHDEGYEAKPVFSGYRSARKSNFCNNNPLISFFCRLQIPRGPPEPVKQS